MRTKYVSLRFIVSCVFAVVEKISYSLSVVRRSESELKGETGLEFILTE